MTTDIDRVGMINVTADIRMTRDALQAHDETSLDLAAVLMDLAENEPSIDRTRQL